MQDPLSLASEGRQDYRELSRASGAVSVFNSIPASITSRISSGLDKDSVLIDPLVPQQVAGDTFNYSSRASQPSLSEQLPENIGSLIQGERRAEVIREEMRASRRWSDSIADRASTLNNPPVIYVPEPQQVQTDPLTTTYTSSARSISTRERIVFPIPQSVIQQGRPLPQLVEHSNATNDADKAKSFFDKYSWVRMEQDLQSSQDPTFNKYMSKQETERIESIIPEKSWKQEGMNEKIGKMPRDEVFKYLKECEDDYKEKQFRAKHIDDGGLAEYNLRESEVRLMEARSMAREELTKISKQTRGSSSNENFVPKKVKGIQSILSVHVREAVGLAVLLQNQAVGVHSPWVYVSMSLRRANPSSQQKQEITRLSRCLPYDFGHASSSYLVQGPDGRSIEEIDLVETYRDEREDARGVGGMVRWNETFQLRLEQEEYIDSELILTVHEVKKEGIHDPTGRMIGQTNAISLRDLYSYGRMEAWLQLAPTTSFVLPSSTAIPQVRVGIEYRELEKSWGPTTLATDFPPAPDKKTWPELEGVPCGEACRKIKQERPDVEIKLLKFSLDTDLLMGFDLAADNELGGGDVLGNFTGLFGFKSDAQRVEDVERYLARQRFQVLVFYQDDGLVRGCPRLRRVPE
ncbi:hypothetical protein GUITHDRAFT_106132 [Guillardia theta CCMP2712]|uniref:C2 domain-containing protein n=1 Tax=Guillardia theta (strain CCMP2712) TaxID=905079 RepID=L1JHS9_GUITC|nr:hypothetical protein GUITHDRAFT_106132 [Guillardia theta CCMP2712]EKX48051.1 hypothetical protein GUITHDRAFT_106132 [Guillardia theta CCMP2712]|eukprot:XP_005835031.1 hypothetical protein GUITHDRAFT_106132 [Guillardia theta CCMP2712]